MSEENKTEMVNENKATEMEAQNQTESKVGMTPEQELEKVREALKKANNEAAKYRKQVEQVEAEKKAKEEAEMTELEKATKKAEELEAKLSALELADKKRSIAEKVGLPPVLAVRLQGTSDEEIEADAKSLLESLPKPEQKTKPSQMNPVNPANPQTGMTDEQVKALVHGEPVTNPFLGGGVVWHKGNEP